MISSFICISCRGSTKVAGAGASLCALSSRPVAVLAESPLVIDGGVHCAGSFGRASIIGVGLFPTLKIAGSSKVAVDTGVDFNVGLLTGGGMGDIFSFPASTNSTISFADMVNSGTYLLFAGHVTVKQVMLAGLSQVI
jgi:hypothetical protein